MTWTVWTATAVKPVSNHAMECLGVSFTLRPSIWLPKYSWCFSESSDLSNCNLGNAYARPVWPACVSADENHYCVGISLHDPFGRKNACSKWQQRALFIRVRMNSSSNNVSHSNFAVSIPQFFTFFFFLPLLQNCVDFTHNSRTA